MCLANSIWRETMPQHGEIGRHWETTHWLWQAIQWHAVTVSVNSVYCQACGNHNLCGIPHHTTHTPHLQIVACMNTEAVSQIQPGGWKKSNIPVPGPRRKWSIASREGLRLSAVLPTVWMRPTCTRGSNLFNLFYRHKYFTQERLTDLCGEQWFILSWPC